ncbi:hypothetical protein [Chryseobacterium indoltheticum]
MLNLQGVYNWYAYSEVLILLGEYEEAVTVLNLALNIIIEQNYFIS